MSVTSGARGGGSAQLSLLASNSRRQVRRHVDSLVLRGKQVARAMASDDNSCEVLSRNPRGVIPPSVGGGISVGMEPRNVEVEVVARSGEEGSRFEEEINQLYGDLGVPENVGVVAPNIEHRDPTVAAKGNGKQVVTGFQGDNSAIVTAPFNQGGNSGKQQYLRDGGCHGQHLSASISTQPIPGLSGPRANAMRIGLSGQTEDMMRAGYSGSNAGSIRVGQGPDLMGLVNGLVTGSNQNPVSTGSGNSTGSRTDGYDPIAPFVFGASGSSRPKQQRKWKKHARVSDKYSFEALTRHMVSRVGDKRLPGFAIREYDQGSAAKRSREVDSDRIDHGVVAIIQPRQVKDPGAEPLAVPAGADDYSVGDDDAELALVSHQGGVGMRMSSVDSCDQLYECIMQIYIAYLCLK
ncbi:hypothetical protein COLO4_18055 [Corchorus olitorius]|uniref:Uncharacterized protein n=1 Tax=Corchorus olitorius TaxID=93759 RepID=A0A1R3JAJ5_9ROSI|nr:hypothetical protein COLO4_18055 [Corchorus olitorius]